MSERIVRAVVEHLKGVVEPWVFTEIFQWFEFFAWEEEFIYGRKPREGEVVFKGLYEMSQEM